MAEADTPVDVHERPWPWPAVSAGVALMTVLAVMAASATVLYVPLRIGTVLVPVCILFAVVSNVALPLLVRQLTRNGLAAALPVAAWLLTMAVLAGSRPEGDVLIPGGRKYQSLAYVFYATVLVGLVAGIATVVRSDGRRRIRPTGSAPSVPSGWSHPAPLRVPPAGQPARSTPSSKRR